jgi:hypothetical protein
MAAATTITFSKVRVLLGDGASPEVFTAPCGFNARAFNRSKNVNEVVVPDCDDEDAPAWVGRDVISLTWNITGEGVLAQESVESWEEFFNSNSSRMVRVEFEFGGSVGLIAYEGAAHLTTYNLGANRGERATINVELQGDGALVAV